MGTLQTFGAHWQNSAFAPRRFKESDMALRDTATPPAIRNPGAPASSGWTWAAFVAAIITVAGSLALTLVENKQACPLCFYQRTFALCLVAILGQGLLSGARAFGRLALLALPLAIAGLGVAMFHVSLEARNILECPTGLFDQLTAPKQSLMMFAVMTLLLGAGVRSGLKAWEIGPSGTILALVLSGGLIWASLSANPKLPIPPTKPYESSPGICRPPYFIPSSN